MTDLRRRSLALNFGAVALKLRRHTLELRIATFESGTSFVAFLIPKRGDPVMVKRGLFVPVGGFQVGLDLLVRLDHGRPRIPGHRSS